MKRLTKLANKYKTDKGTEHDYCHGFTEFYEPYFSKYENPTILEIGTAEGSSAKMLNDFFDGDCIIYTIDINPYCGKNVEGYKNIHFININPTTEESVNKLFNEIIPDIKFDIIIEDGSHFWDEQISSLRLLSEHLNENGIYAMEDLHTSLTSPEYNVQSPLYYVNFLECGNFYLDVDLQNRIKDIIVYNRYNEKNPSFNNRSITSIITFK